MKKPITLIKKIRCALLLCAGIILLNACDDKEDIPLDAGNYEIYVYHTNPKTGLDYTAVELTELTYNPNRGELYSEGQNIDLALITSKQPSELKIISGTDFSVIETITEFSSFENKFKANSYSTTLEGIGLLEIGDKITLKFEVVFTDGSSGADYFNVKRVKFQSGNAGIDTYVFLKKSTGETIGLETDADENFTSKSEDIELGTIVSFNGVDNQVEIPNDNTESLDFRYLGDYSIGFWVNTTSTDSDPIMIGDQDWNSSGNKGLSIAFKGDKWRVAVSDGDGHKADAETSGIPFNDGEWHFLTATFDRDGDMTMYQDGVAVANSNMTEVGNTKSGDPLHIAQDGPATYGQFFEGKMGEVFIYDYVLSAEQVASESAFKSGVKLLKQDGARYNIPVTNSGADVSLEDDLFTYACNGTDQYATIRNNDDLAFRFESDYSISFWVNTTSEDSDPVMIGDQNWNSSGNKGLTIAFKGNKWRVAVSDGVDHKADAETSDIPFNDGQWHMLVVTFDRDGDMSLYQDGDLVASDNMADVGNTNSGDPLRIAQDGPATYGQFFNGKIAETVIYDYVLSATDITGIYNN